jgi:hypothetical protein
MLLLLPVGLQLAVWSLKNWTPSKVMKATVKVTGKEKRTIQNTKMLKAMVAVVMELVDEMVEMLEGNPIWN